MRGVTITVATRPPATIIAGDSVAFTLTYADYAAPTWSLNWALSGGSSKSVDSTDNADGTSHDLALTATETAALAAGTYQWRIRATDGTTTTTLETGTLVVSPDIGEALPGSLVSHWAALAEKCRTALAEIVSGASQGWMIDGHQYNALNLDKLRALLADCEMREAMESGTGFGRAIRYNYRGSVSC